MVICDLINSVNDISSKRKYEVTKYANKRTKYIKFIEKYCFIG